MAADVESMEAERVIGLPGTAADALEDISSAPKRRLKLDDRTAPLRIVSRAASERTGPRRGGAARFLVRLP